MKTLNACFLAINGVLAFCACQRPTRFCGNLSMSACWLGLLLITGCVSSSNQLWNSRAGNYTAQQAVKDLGRPVQVVALSDGSQVGSWMTRAGTRGSLLYGHMPIYSNHLIDFYMWSDAPYIPDQYLRLLFAPDGKLITWDRQYK